MKENRLLEMEKYIKEHKTVSLDTLCTVFDVSKNTIRRDVAQLTKLTDIKKIYGGVSIEFNRIPPSFSERSSVNTAVKQRMGKAAAQLVQDGDVIYVDSGTTTCQMINYLQDKKNVTIITNSIDVITRAFNYPNLNVLVIAGILNRRTFSFTDQTGEVLHKYNINKAFMATTGLTIENGATQAAPYEVVIKSEAERKSDHVVLLAESSKIGHVCLYTTSDINQVNCIITDSTPDEKFVESFSKLGGRIIVA